MVRVVIQRHLKEGKKGDLLPMLRELRAVAMHYSGLYNRRDPSQHRRPIGNLGAKHLAKPGGLEVVGEIRGAK